MCLSWGSVFCRFVLVFNLGAQFLQIWVVVFNNRYTPVKFYKRHYIRKCIGVTMSGLPFTHGSLAVVLRLEVRTISVSMLIHSILLAQPFVLFRRPASPTVVSSVCELHCFLTEVVDE